MRSRLAVVLVAAMTVVLWTLPATAAASTDHTWTGGAATSADGSRRWSRDANWSTAPPFGHVGTLTFPKLRAGCSWCYAPRNDIVGITAEAIVLDDGEPYFFSKFDEGEGISLGASGLTATTTSTKAVDPEDAPIIGLPITLAASQTWSIDGGPSKTAGVDVYVPSGNPEFGLTVELTRRGWIVFDNANVPELGPVSFVGGDDEGGTVIVTDSNTWNGGPISLSNHVLLRPAEDTVETVGPLHVSASRVDLPTATALEVLGDVSLDAASELDQVFEPESSTYLTATGNVELGGATLKLINDGSIYRECDPPPNGTVYKFVTTRRGTITGTFGNAPPGSVIATANCARRPTWLRIDYTPKAVTATVVAPTVTRATSIGSVSATLHGTIDTNGAETTWFFRFGLWNRSKSTTSTHTLAAGQSEPVAVTVPLDHLAPDTDYEFQLIATNADGTRRSEVRKFHTKPIGKVTLLGKRLQAVGRTIPLRLRCDSRRACRGTLTLVYGTSANGIGCGYGRARIKPRAIAEVHLKLHPECVPDAGAAGRPAVLSFDPTTGQRPLKARIIVTRARNG